MITCLFDPASKTPLYEQLYRFVRTEIEHGRLRADEKMPSKRELAAHLKVSIVTVESAFAQLVAEGYLRGVPRSGYYVQVFEAMPQKASAPLPPKILTRTAEPAAYDYDFGTGGVITSLFPFATWAKLAREVLALNSDELLNVTHPQGVPSLREEIAAHLYKFRGIRVPADSIVVGAGSEYLLVLLLQLLGRERIYALENPCYGKIYKLFQSNDIRTIPIALDEHGLSVRDLTASDASVVHVTPSHQFPTGIVMPVGRRMNLLQWAAAADNRYIIEDDYDSEFRFAGQPIPAMQGLDHADKVIYINAFTKSLAPSLRISYLVLPPPLMERYREKFMFYSCTVPNFEQYTLYRFLHGGYFERHLNRMRNACKERRDLFITLLKDSRLGEVAEPVGAEAGLHFLLRVNNGMSERDLTERAAEKRVRLRGLSEYYSPPPVAYTQSALVIGYAGLAPEHLPDALRRLEDAWL